MKNKLFSLLLALLLLSLTGCTLAREPDEQQSRNNQLAEARFIGVYVVREDPSVQPDRTHWVEYGTVAAETEFGQVSFANKILIGTYDTETHEFSFPGLEGFALFALTAMEDGRVLYRTMINDMVDGSFHVTATDAGDSYDLSATLYYGPPADEPNYDQRADNRVWHHYHVYQMADGTVFLSGYGDSHAGSMTSTLTMTYTATVDGEAMEYYTKTEVNVEYIDRLTALTVLQYDKDGRLLTRTELPAEGELPAVRWLPNAEWAVVVELRGEEATRTVCSRPADGETAASHTVILLDREGMGRPGTLRFE